MICGRCCLSARVQTLRQRSHELSARVQTELLDRLEARRLQRPQSTASDTASSPTPTATAAAVATTASSAVDVPPAQPDVLQRIQHCLQAVQGLQVTILDCMLIGTYCF